MKKYYPCLAIMLFFCFKQTSITAQNQKQFKRLDFEPEIHFCPVSTEYDPHFIPRRQVLRPKNFNTVFNVNYDGNVPPAARLAFEKGVLDILGDFINSTVPINIQINWRQLEGNSLAGASPTAYYSRFPNVPNPSEVYPVALAEKISGRPLNDPDEPDITITVNSSTNWYYDYLNPEGVGNRYDFVSVLLHEVFHGLGFTAVVNVSNDIGAIGLFSGGRYSIYSDFLFNGSGKKISEVRDNSSAMASELQGNSLYFNFISSPSRAKLYAPLNYDRGSSISHLDELTYNNTPNALMTPSIGPGQVEQDPGIALEMLYDMGWDMTYMIHQEEPGIEDITQDQLLLVEVISDSEFDEESLVIHYSRDTFNSQDIVEPLVQNPETGLYEFTLPAPNEEAVYNYYFTAKNSRKVTFTNPGKAPTNLFTFQYKVDDEKPVVQHESPGEINSVDPQFVVEAEITDDYLGIETATILWKINGIAQEPVLMERQTGFSPQDTTDLYKGVLEFPNGALDSEDILEYQIVAVDKAKAKNETIAPEDGFWTLEVTAIAASVNSYLNDFDQETFDFTGEGFSIREYANFPSIAIHSTHPYPESGQGNFKSYTYELKIPVIIREEDPLIEFDEIVLVEIGEPGTTFGEDEFWDYVIVEGKRVGESEWLPFLPGYDSGDRIEWTNAYNRGQNGIPSLYFPRTIDMTQNGNFSPGDEVFVRFRLFSDPFANAWGWAIDNLRIQDDLTSVNDFVFEDHFSVYPNPVMGDEVTVSIDLEKIPEFLELRVFDVYGRQVDAYRLDDEGKQIRRRISLARYEKGMYLMVLSSGEGDVITRKIIRN